ncbi:MAG: hypothetical protein Q9210_007151, partial [Variospora velana]
IVLRIVDELVPEDLVSFILTNKAICQVSGHALRNHQALMKKYSSIRFGDAASLDGEHFDEYHPLYLLEAILQNPRIARYPIKILIGDYTDDYAFDNDSAAEHSAGIISDWKSEIAALGTENRWLNGEWRRHAWREALLVPTNHAYHLAILLTMLPNLELIKITSMSNRISQPIREIVWAIAAANQDPASPTHEQALTNLLEISLDCSDTEYGEDITMYAPFTALPSVRCVHGCMIDGEYSHECQRRDEWHEGPQPSQLRQVEEIQIVYSAIDRDAWEWMFQAIGPNLKRFIYDHNGLRSSMAYYDPAGIIELLRTHSSHCLVRLDITTDMDTEDGDMDDIDDMTGEILRTRFASDMRMFTALRVLRLDDTAFQKPRGGAIVRLVDVLPASIRVLKLVREITVGDPADLFVGLAEGKKVLLPELKKIGLQGDYVLRRNVVDECKAVGIGIEGFDLQIVG